MEAGNGSGPARLVEGTSIVSSVAPLTAIMNDQVSVASRGAYLRPQAQARPNVAK